MEGASRGHKALTPDRPSDEGRDTRPIPIALPRSPCAPARVIRRARAQGALVGFLVVTIVACSAPEPVPLTPPKEAAGAAVVRKSIGEPASSVATAAPAPTPAAPSPIVVPPDAQYVCVSDLAGARTQTSIAFAPKVANLCLRHPEMGPCQYERNLCRRSGGRVYAAGGVEITMDTEAEYDRKVLRVRFQSN